MKHGAEPPDHFDPPKPLKKPKQKIGAFFKPASTTEKAEQDVREQDQLDADLLKQRACRCSSQAAGSNGSKAAGRAAPQSAGGSAADSRAKQPSRW
jgi:hypothetical protein